MVLITSAGFRERMMGRVPEAGFRLTACASMIEGVSHELSSPFAIQNQIGIILSKWDNFEYCENNQNKFTR